MMLPVLIIRIREIGPVMGATTLRARLSRKGYHLRQGEHGSEFQSSRELIVVDFRWISTGILFMPFFWLLNPGVALLQSFGVAAETDLLVHQLSQLQRDFPQRISGRASRSERRELFLFVG